MASEEATPSTAPAETEVSSDPPPAEAPQTEQAPVEAPKTEQDVLAALVKDEKVIFQAAKEGDLEVVTYMVKHGGVDVDIADKDNWRPLHFAAQSGKLEVVKFLIDNKADPHASKSDNSTALHDAAYNGNVGVCELLLANKGDVNVPDEDGWTPLHYAAASGNQDAFSYLVKNGADPNAKTSDGKSVYKLAFAEGNRDIIKLLEEVMDVRDDKMEIQGAASSKILALEEELSRALAEKQELKDALAKKESESAKEAPKADTPAADGKDKEGAPQEEAELSKSAKRKKKAQQKKKNAEETHEEAADALDASLKTFTANAAKLDALLVEKRVELEQAELGKYAPEKMEVYYEQMMELYSLKAEEVTITPPEPAPQEGQLTVVTTGEYHYLPVSCVLLLDVLYHPYFKDKLAKQIALISTVTHPNIAQFQGLCFKKGILDPPEAETKAGKKKKQQQQQEKEKKADEEHKPQLPYEDVAVKDHEICLVYEALHQPLQQVIAEGVPLGFKCTVDLMLGLAAALAHMHAKGHVHNYINSSSIWVDTKKSAKFTLFGATKCSNIFRRYKVQRGLVDWYCAPEQVDPNPKKKPPPPSKLYDFGAPEQDVYSLGMILIALCSMKEEGKPADLAKQMKPSGLRDLCYLMTKPKPEDRPTAEQIAASLDSLRSVPEYAS